MHMYLCIQMHMNLRSYTCIAWKHIHTHVLAHVQLLPAVVGIHIHVWCMHSCVYLNIEWGCAYVVIICALLVPIFMHDACMLPYIILPRYDMIWYVQELSQHISNTQAVCVWCPICATRKRCDCMSVCISVCSFVRLSVYLSVPPSVLLSVCQSAGLSANLSV